MVTVTPAAFTLVLFDAARIAELAAGVAAAVGLADLDLSVHVDEASMLQRIAVTTLAPPRVVIDAQGGAFEDRKRSRHLSDEGVQAALARVLYRVRDRLDPAFGPAPADADLDLRQATAWDAYSMGRAERAGLAHQRSRRLYHFRNRHGFTDRADAVFERLWAASDLAWTDIEEACRETAVPSP